MEGHEPTFAVGDELLLSTGRPTVTGIEGDMVRLRFPGSAAEEVMSRDDINELLREGQEALYGLLT